MSETARFHPLLSLYPTTLRWSPSCKFYAQLWALALIRLWRHKVRSTLLPLLWVRLMPGRWCRIIWRHSSTPTSHSILSIKQHDDEGSIITHMLAIGSVLFLWYASMWSTGVGNFRNRPESDILSIRLAGRLRAIPYMLQCNLRRDTFDICIPDWPLPEAGQKRTYSRCCRQSRLPRAEKRNDCFLSYPAINKSDTCSQLCVWQ